MDDYFTDGDIDAFEESGWVCKTCEHYQQEIYKMNCKLRTDLSNEEYEKTREHLGNLIQVQLHHQREHAV